MQPTSEDHLAAVPEQAIESAGISYTGMVIIRIYVVYSH